MPDLCDGRESIPQLNLTIHQDKFLAQLMMLDTLWETQLDQQLEQQLEQ